MEKLTTLYRFFDENDTLLYVGITIFMPQRARQHAKNSEWHRFATRAELEHFESREEALQAESIAIRTERPAYNIAGSSQYAENEITHFHNLWVGNLEDPIHKATLDKVEELMATCNTKSPLLDKIMWAFLNAMYELWDEDKLPCIPCRALANDDILQAAHYRVCTDYENELREAAK